MLLLATGTGSTVTGDPSERSLGRERMAVVVSRAEWALFPGELQEVWRVAPGAPRSPSGVTGIAPVEQRLTVTLEEAATILGSSRALAHEVVDCGEIPSIRNRPARLIPRPASTGVLVAINRAQTPRNKGREYEEAVRAHRYPP